MMPITIPLSIRQANVYSMDILPAFHWLWKVHNLEARIIQLMPVITLDQVLLTPLERFHRVRLR